MHADIKSHPEIITTDLANHVETPRETNLELTSLSESESSSPQKDNRSDKEKKSAEGTPERAKTPLPIAQEPFY